MTQNRTTTVKSLAVVARRKTYHTGATVQESWFAVGEFDRLISAGHLNPVKEAQEPEKQDPPKQDPPKLEFQETAKIEPLKPLEEPLKAENINDEKDDVEDLNMGELRAELKKRGIQFKPTDKKDDLIKLLASGGN